MQAQSISCCPPRGKAERSHIKLLVALAVILAVPTSKETVVPARGVEERAPSPVAYEEYSYSLLEDGTFIYEGGLVYNCADLPRLVGDPGSSAVRRALGACAELEFLPLTGVETLPDTWGVLPLARVVPVALSTWLVL